MNKNQVKTLCKKDLWLWNDINDNKENLRQKNYHLSQID
jgi:hypothetical protein